MKVTVQVLAYFASISSSILEGTNIPDPEVSHLNLAVAFPLLTMENCSATLMLILSSVKLNLSVDLYRCSEALYPS